MVTDSTRIAIILAGGRSSRMGFNKANAKLNDQTLLEHGIIRLSPQVDTLLISTNEALPAATHYPQLKDTIDDYAGPLAGVLSGLIWLQNNTPASEWLLSVSVDTPFLPGDLYQQLRQQAEPPLKIISARSNHRLHPTCSLWHISLIEALQQFLLQQQQRRMMSFLESQPSASVDFNYNGLDPFCNINTVTDLKQTAAKL